MKLSDIDMITKDQLAIIWDGLETRKYLKNAEVMIRMGKVGEKIETVIDDVVETSNVVKDNQVVIRGVSNEEYVIDIEKFEKLYSGPEISDEFQLYKSLGKIIAGEYSGDSLTFEAPWGEPMILENGDYLAHGIDDGPDSLYRIERDVFENTYAEIHDDEI